MIFILLSLFLTKPLLAAELSWSISASSQAVVGQETTIIYKTTVSKDAKLSPDPFSSATSSFVVVNVTAVEDGAWAWRLLALDEGNLLFQSHWNLNGASMTAPAVKVNVQPAPLPKEATINDIKAPRAARRALWPWLLAAIIGALVWELWRRFKPKAASTILAQDELLALTPEEAAQEAIADLLASGIWERQEYALFYLKLTEALRVYIEARYQQPATAMTSIEVARLVKAQETDLKISAMVRELLLRADLVKFARFTPESNEGPKDADLALTVVRMTTPKRTQHPEVAS